MLCYMTCYAQSNRPYTLARGYMHSMYSMRQIKAQDYVTGNTLISMHILLYQCFCFPDAVECLA